MKKFLFVCMFFVLSPFAVFAQNVITGTVLDDTSVPLIGAAVMIKGTNVGEITDEKGKFSIEVPVGTVLLFSMVGYEEKQIPAENNMTVILQLESTKLEDAVVIGYGTVKKSDLTGAVTSIKSDDLTQTPSHSVDQMLRGKIAGLQVYTGNNQPGASATIRIRGNSSIHGSNSPLYVVDGFPIGDAGNLKVISPNDIESIEVLKDASAAAIYGSRGANGVIIITTKSGKNGKTSVNFSAKSSFSTFAKAFDIIKDPALYATIDNERNLNGGGIPKYIGDYYDGVYYPSIEEIRTGIWKYSTDWEKEIYRIGITQDYNLSVSGKTESNNYSISMGYFDQQGIQIGSDYSKMTARVKFVQNIFKNIKVGTDILINNAKNHQTANVGVSRSPVFPVYDENGEYFMLSSQDYFHPIALADNVLDVGKSFDFYGLGYFDVDIIEDLNLRAQIGYSSSKSTKDEYSPRKYTSAGELNNGVGSISMSEGHKILPEVYATYEKTIKSLHYLSIMGGFSAELNEARGLNAVGMGFVSDILQNEDLQSASVYNISNSYSKTVLNSWLFRANYTFANKLLFTLTARADGCSKFSANHKWAFFPSGAVSWKIHEEPFMRSLKHIISESKVRVSYGVTGNQGISPYQTLLKISNTSNYYLNNGYVTGFGPGQVTEGQNYSKIWEGLASNNLKWETTKQFNAGLDLGFFDDRLTVNFDWYYKYTTDLLRRSWLPPSTGSDRMWVNNGEVLNRGFEISVNSRIISNKDFQWDLGFIVSRNRNVLKKLEFYDESGSRSSFEYLDANDNNFGGIGCSILQIGQPIGVFYGYVYDGIMQTEQEGLDLGLTGLAAAPGEQKFKNLVDLVDEYGNPVNEGKIGPEDRTIIGSPEPDFTFSINTSLAYKGIDLSININGMYGNEIFNKSLQSSAKARVERWTPDNTDTIHPRLRTGKKWFVSDYFIEDGSYAKLSNITLGYTYNIQKKYLNSVRVFLSGDNLFTLTRFSGYDPEVAYNGIVGGGYPKQRSVTVGLNINF